MEKNPFSIEKSSSLSNESTSYIGLGGFSTRRPVLDEELNKSSKI
jgi:hypothetical protein